MGLFETIGTNVGGMFAAKRNKEAAEKQRKQNLNYVESMDWTPAYAQDQMSNQGAYQKTDSPLARAYLESVLTGNNPDTTFSGSPNAAHNKMMQGQSRDQMYGTQQQLQQRSAQNAATNPYQTWTPSSGPPGGEPMNGLPGAVGRTAGDMPYEKEFQVLNGLGIDEATHKRLVDNGIMPADRYRNADSLGTKKGAEAGVTANLQKIHQATLAKLDAGDVEGAKKLYNQLYSLVGLESHPNDY